MAEREESRLLRSPLIQNEPFETLKFRTSRPRAAPRPWRVHAWTRCPAGPIQEPSRIKARPVNESGRIVEDHTQRVPLSGPELADAVSHGDAIVAAGSTVRPPLDREHGRVALGLGRREG